MIRKLEQREYDEAVRLSLDVFMECGKADFDEEGLEVFKSFVFDPRRIAELVMYGAFEEGRLIGVIGTKNEGKHISLFFIDKAYHRKGWGKQLFNAAMQGNPEQAITVNSSTYAVPFYRRLGFEVLADPQNYHGLISVPMRRACVKEPVYLLRSWQESDIPSLAFHLNNKRIWDNCRDALPFPYTESDARSFIQYVRTAGNALNLCLEIDGEAVGNICFTKGTDVERFNAEVGYWIAEPYWNRGVTTAALKEAIQICFDRMDVHRLYAIVFEYNKASMRVLEKVGFRKVSVFQKYIYKNNHFCDASYYEFLKG